MPALLGRRRHRVLRPVPSQRPRGVHRGDAARAGQGDAVGVSAPLVPRVRPESRRRGRHALPLRGLRPRVLRGPPAERRGDHRAVQAVPGARSAAPGAGVLHPMLRGVREVGQGTALRGGRGGGGGGGRVDHRRQSGAHRRVDRGTRPRDRAPARSHAERQEQAPRARHIYRPRTLSAPAGRTQAQGRRRRRAPTEERGYSRQRIERPIVVGGRDRGDGPAARGYTHDRRRQGVLHRGVPEARRDCPT